MYSLKAKKCREMTIDFRKQKTVIPPLDLYCMRSVVQWDSAWVDDDLQWKSNMAENIIKKAAELLYLLKILKSYGAPKSDLKAFY